VHLCAEHRDVLFGNGYTLTRWKDLIQPGQYATKEVVTLVGEKGKIEKVRVLGPVRKETQVEISGTDQFILGLQVPVRDSGNLKGTPGVRLLGPAGEVVMNYGVIRALRHIHMTPEDARQIGVKDHDIVDVRLNGDRATVCEGVLIRVSESGALEMHIDTDEANAAGVPSESIGEILGPSLRTNLD
jgi:putative phosphotransacetylase